MSSMALVEGPGGVLAAFETRGQIFLARIRPGTNSFSRPQGAPGTPNGRKHPALAFNREGASLLAWTEGTGWNQGGTLAWQVYDPSGRPTARHGRLEGAIPVWGLPAVVATGDGFTILY